MGDTPAEGAEVKIKADGKTQAIVKLPAGVYSRVTGLCEFKFSTDVPAGLKFYTIDLGQDAGHKEFSEKEIAAGVTIDRLEMDDIKY